MSAIKAVPNVSLMEIGPAAGHTTMGTDGQGKACEYPVFIDQTSLEQVRDAAKRFKNGVKLMTSHDGGSKDIIGSITESKITDGKLIGNANFNTEHPDFASYDYSVTQIPDTLGLSAGFEPSYEFKDGKAFVRCNELYHYALEPETAATTGMFKSGPTKNSTMVDRKTNQTLSLMDDELTKHLSDAVSNATAAAMEPYKECMAYVKECMAKDAKSKEKGGEDSGDIHVHLKTFTDELAKFKTELPGMVKENVTSTMTNFAKENLGIKFTDAPKKDPVKPDEKKDGETFEGLCKKSIESGQFKKQWEAVAHFTAKRPDLHKDYLARSAAASVKAGKDENRMIPIA